MKKLLTFIFVFSLTLGYSQEEILEWSIGTPVVTCGSDPSTDPTVICYPLQVSISNAANSPALGTTTMRFFYDTNYMNTLDIQNVQNGYTASGLSDNNSPVLGGPLGFSTDNAGVVDFNILDNAAANPINLSTTPVTVLDLCFTITTTGDALGLANNALCTPITFSNDHTTPSGATEDEGYGPNEGVVGFYYLNGNTGAPIAADDEALYYGWIPDPAFDGTLDSLADNIGATDTNNCTPYLCGVDPCDAIASGNPDNDLDGISDECDLDDDNDGILDVDEGCDSSQTEIPVANEIFLISGDPANVYSYDVNTTTRTLITTLASRHNGMAFNTADRYMWLNDRANNTLKVYDPANSWSLVSGIAATSLPGVISATFDPIRKEYVANSSSTVYVLDGNPDNATYGQLLRSFANTIGNGFLDSAFNPNDGFIYAIRTNTPSATDAQMIRINTTPASSSTTNIGAVSGLPRGSYGRAFYSRDGNMYFVRNSTRVLYSVNLNNGLVANNVATLNGISSTDPGRDAASIPGVDFNENLVCRDSDGDGIVDAFDLDSDNDGIYDVVEAGGTDNNLDGIADGSVNNTPGTSFGIPSSAGTGLTPLNTDSTDLPDFMDLDSDNDGCSDANEYYETGNADGNASGLDNAIFGTGNPVTGTSGLINIAGYNGTTTGLSDARNPNIGDACIFIQITDGNWAIPSNWRETAVPTFNNDASIASNVQSQVTSNQEVKSLTLIQGTTELTEVNISDGFTLNVKVNLENNGEFFGDGEVVMDGNVNQNLSGSGDYENLRINNANGADVLNVNLNDPTEINGVLYVDNGDFTTSNNVLFPCTFTEPTASNFANGRTGQIGPIGTSATITGDVRVEQCYPGRRAYRYVSASTNTTTSIQDNWQENATAFDNIPVASTTQDDGIPFGFGTHITGLGSLPAHSTTDPNTTDQTNGLDWQPSGNPSMFEFNEAIQDFDPVLVTESETEPDNLAAGKAYNMIIRGSRQVDLTTNASPTSNTKLRSTGTAEKGFTYSSSVNSEQYMLVGNPFHAIVDMKAVYASNSSALGQFMYAFDPTLGGSPDSNPTSTLLAGRGAFVTIDLNDPTNVNENSIGEMRHYLQAYQGVFLQAATNNPTLNFSEVHKAVDQPQIDVFSSPTDRVAITLYDQQSYSANNTADDKVIIQFGQNKNSGIDYDDALKFFNPDENLGRLEGSSLLSIEDRAMPQIDEVLELYTTNYRTTDYIFVAKVDGLAGNTVYLYDKYTNTETVLSNDASTPVNFTVDPANPASEATDRFELRFDMSTLGTTDFDLQGISVYPNPASDILNINLGDNTGRFENIQLFDINGRLIATENLSNNVLDVQMDVNRFSSGVYLLKVSSDSEEFTTKVIIE